MQTNGNYGVRIKQTGGVLFVEPTIRPAGKSNQRHIIDQDRLAKHKSVVKVDDDAGIVNAVRLALAPQNGDQQNAEKNCP